MWMRDKNGNFVNMDMMERMGINLTDGMQLVVISPLGKSYVMAECKNPEDAKELLDCAATILNLKRAK